MASETPIADMVEAMLASGSLPAMIVLAVRTVEVSREASRSSRVTQRDETIREQERARSQNYRNRKRNRGGMAVPADNVTDRVTRDDLRDDALTLSSSIQEGTSEGKKELPAVNEDTGKRRQRKKTSVALPDDWRPGPTHYEAAKKLNVSEAFVERKADDMRIWAKSNDSRKVDWDMTFHGFLRRDAGGQNGNGNRALGANGTAEPGARPPPIVAGVGRAFAKRFGPQSPNGGGSFCGSPNASRANGADRTAEDGDRSAPAQLELVAQPDAGKR